MDENGEVLPDFQPSKEFIKEIEKSEFITIIEKEKNENISILEVKENQCHSLQFIN